MLKEKSEKLESLLKIERSHKDIEIEKAKSEAMLRASNAINMAFQKGLKAGADLVTGKTFTIESPVPMQLAPEGSTPY